MNHGKVDSTCKNIMLVITIMMNPCQTLIKENFIVLELHNEFRLQMSYMH
jgi:hypothetical protein